MTNLSFDEYADIYTRAYLKPRFATTVQGRGTVFEELVADAEAKLRKVAVAPHKCKRDRRQVTKHGEKVTVEWRH